MSDNITLPRKVLQYALQFVTNSRWGTWPYMEGQVYADAHDLAKALRTALAAEQPKQEPVAWMYVNFDGECEQIEYGTPPTDDDSITPLYTAPPDAEALRRDAEQPKHPGYIIGSHWLETAYSRICAGEAEADVLRDCGWERVDDIEALRRDAERYRWMKQEVKRIPPSWGLIGWDAAIDAAMEDKP